MSKRLIMVTLAILGLLAMPSAHAQEEGASKKTVQDPMGYFLGISVGQQLRTSGFRSGDFGVEGLIEGFNDGLNDKDVALTEEQLRETKTKIQDLLQQRQAVLEKEARAKGEEYLAENAKKKGIKTLEGGVQYQVLKAGKGESPTPTDTVKVHYTGKLIGGKVFDSSVQRGQPATFRVNQVIQGWQTALQSMKVGDKWMLHIPSDLAYGAQGSQGAIGPHEVLVFEVELLAIQ